MPINWRGKESVVVSLTVNICVRIEKNMEKVMSVRRCSVQSAITPAKKIKGVSYFDISKPVISIQAFCLLSLSLSFNLLPSTQRYGLYGLTIFWSNRSKQFIENRWQTGVIQEHKLSRHILVAARLKHCVRICFCSLVYWQPSHCCGRARKKGMGVGVM